jgi:hypothetical protein
VANIHVATGSYRPPVLRVPYQPAAGPLNLFRAQPKGTVVQVARFHVARLELTLPPALAAQVVQS